ncbi:MAG: hypothetical protein ACYTFY_09830 [Planctomycetota bacterium]
MNGLKDFVVAEQTGEDRNEKKNGDPAKLIMLLQDAGHNPYALRA